MSADGFETWGPTNMPTVNDRLQEWRYELRRMNAALFTVEELAVLLPEIDQPLAACDIDTIVDLALRFRLAKRDEVGR